VQKRPKSKAFAAILRQSKVDPAMFDASGQSVRGNRRDVGRGEVALQKIIELHEVSSKLKRLSRKAFAS
jgi:hypothetical protein